MLRLVVPVRTDILQELTSSIDRVIKIGDLRTTLAVTSNRRKMGSNTMMMVALRFSESSVLTRATRRKIPEDSILHSHRSVNLSPYCHIKLKSYAEYFPS
jgi:hypothetical protein